MHYCPNTGPQKPVVLSNIKMQKRKCDPSSTDLDKNLPLFEYCWYVFVHYFLHYPLFVRSAKPSTRFTR